MACVVTKFQLLLQEAGKRIIHVSKDGGDSFRPVHVDAISTDKVKDSPGRFANVKISSGSHEEVDFRFGSSIVMPKYKILGK